MRQQHARFEPVRLGGQRLRRLTQLFDLMVGQSIRIGDNKNRGGRSQMARFLSNRGGCRRVRTYRAAAALEAAASIGGFAGGSPVKRTRQCRRRASTMPLARYR